MITEVQVRCPLNPRVWEAAKAAILAENPGLSGDKVDLVIQALQDLSIRCAGMSRLDRAVLAAIIGARRYYTQAPNTASAYGMARSDVNWIGSLVAKLGNDILVTQEFCQRYSILSQQWQEESS